jgi:hypothetical protein
MLLFMSRYLQGTFVPKHPEKYIGDITKISFRSSWERRAMLWFDEQPNILRWNSEEIIIPYISPLDGKPHRYFPDFLVEVKKADGKIVKTLVEIKPAAQCVPPTQKKKTKRMITEMQTYMVNQSKWAAARDWCKRNGIEFLILDEFGLGIKK